MMFQYQQNELVHWNYYLALENDAMLISRYIEFCEDNEKTYLIELARLLLSASSEIDVVLKMLCERYAENKNNIDQYREFVKKHFPSIITETIILDRYSMQSKPWESWGENKNPEWWKAYNNVKHHRNEKYAEANLKNAINSLGGLLILLTYYYQDISQLPMKDSNRMLRSSSNLIRLNEEYYYRTRIV